MIPLIVLLLTLPFIDFYVLFKATQVIGFLNTLGIIVLTGIIGAYLVKREGLHVVAKLTQSVTPEEVTRNMMEGLILVVSGLSLITPGFITDAAGFLMLWRPVRERLARRIEPEHVQVRMTSPM